MSEKYMSLEQMCQAPTGTSALDRDGDMWTKVDDGWVFVGTRDDGWVLVFTRQVHHTEHDFRMESFDEFGPFEAAGDDA